MTNAELMEVIKDAIDKTSVQHVLVALSTIMYTRGETNAAMLIAQVSSRPAIINLGKKV